MEEYNVMDRDNVPLTAPLLDRLLGHNKGVDLTRGYNLVRCIKESIRRDLENLFNTRYCRISPPKESTHLQSSVLNFGLPDLSAINMTSKESRQKFCKDVEVSVGRFEPRIKSISVTMADKIGNEDPVIRFQLTATLNVNPLQDRVIFNSSMDPINKTVNVLELF